MQSTPTFDLQANRYAVFEESVLFVDQDFTAASFAMQVRDRKDGGMLRADLATVTTASAEGVRLIYAGTDTLANHLTAERITAEDAARLPYALADNVLLSELGIRINKSTMAAMPMAPEVGNDNALFWDLQVTPSGGNADVYARGKFIVVAGVVQ